VELNVEGLIFGGELSLLVCFLNTHLRDGGDVKPITFLRVHFQHEEGSVGFFFHKAKRWR